MKQIETVSKMIDFIPTTLSDNYVKCKSSKHTKTDFHLSKHTKSYNILFTVKSSKHTN